MRAGAGGGSGGVGGADAGAGAGGGGMRSDAVVKGGDARWVENASPSMMMSNKARDLKEQAMEIYVRNAELIRNLVVNG